MKGLFVLHLFTSCYSKGVLMKKGRFSNRLFEGVFSRIDKLISF